MWFYFESIPWAAAGASLAFAFMLTLLYYAVSKFVNIPTLTAAVKEMMVGLIFSAILLGIMAILYIIFN